MLTSLHYYSLLSFIRKLFVQNFLTSEFFYNTYMHDQSVRKKNTVIWNLALIRNKWNRILNFSLGINAFWFGQKLDDFFVKMICKNFFGKNIAFAFAKLIDDFKQELALPLLSLFLFNFIIVLTFCSYFCLPFWFDIYLHHFISYNNLKGSTK